MHEPPQFSRSFAPNSTLPQYARVRLLSNGKLGIADLADRGIGIIMRPAFTADVTNETPIAVALDGPIRKAIADEAFAAGVELFSETGGHVQATAVATSWSVGISLQAAGANGDIIDFMVSSRPTVQA